MDDKRFDALTRSLAEGTSRRSVVKGLFGGLAGGISLGGWRRASAQDEGTPVVEDAGVLLDVCAAEHVCGEGCCDKDTKCCFGSCIPWDACCEDKDCGGCGHCREYVCVHPECCGDWDCGGCEACIEGSCRPQCDPSRCCEDEKGSWCSEECCTDRECEGCDICHGGWCIDGCEPKGLVCCGFDTLVAEENGPICAECCDHADCGPCEQCNRGWCEFVCDKHEQCCQADIAPSEHVLNGGFCAVCCGREDCGDCEDCYQGTCVYACSEREVCCHGDFCAHEEEGCCGLIGDWCDASISVAENLNGSCCRELLCCFDDKTKSGACAQCCHDDHCPPSWLCCGGECRPECCDDKDCREGVCNVDGFCVECLDHHDCGKDAVCCGGACYRAECCGDEDCGECEFCDRGECRLIPDRVPFGEACRPFDFALAEGSPQLNCCDGLFCCETKHHDLVCLQCCHDGDCAKGCTCHDGICSCGCGSDKDCAAGTCCCKNGSCSADCCPGKPGDDGKDDDGASVGGETVGQLPSTGTGSSQSGAGIIGAAALGAAAVYLAGKKLREEPEAKPAGE